MAQLRKFLRLTSAERRLLVRAVILLWAIRLGLVVLPFQTIRRLLGRVAPAPAIPRNAASIAPPQFAWATAVASRYVPGTGSCLTRALAVQVWLEREGYPADLRIGVARDEGEGFHAHAWVESEGHVVIGGSGLERYATLTAWESKRL